MSGRDSSRGGNRMSSTGMPPRNSGGDGCCSRENYEPWQKARVWVITFLSYMSFHLARKVYSIVKEPLVVTQVITSDEAGALVTIFLVSYALGMLMMGYIADRSNLRYFLSFMMVGSGVGCAICGLLGKHAGFGSLAALYVVTGVFQSGGWPSNVAVMGVWFGKKTRGLVMGVWNAHTSVGNILGGLIATAMLVQASYDYSATSMPVSATANWTQTHQVNDKPKAFVFNPPQVLPVNHPPIGKYEYVMSDADLKKTCDADIKCAAYVSRLKAVDDWLEDEAGEFGTDSSWSPNGANATKMYDVYFLQDTNGFHIPCGAHKTAEECPWKFNIKQVPWEKSFFALGAEIFVAGLIVFLFLVPHPHNVNLPTPDEAEREAAGNAPLFSEEAVGLLSNEQKHQEKQAVSPLQALCIPGVIEFALCFFFAKFVSYTFLFWLPDYLESIGFGTTKAGDLSTVFDVGGIVGGITCGVISDRIKSRAIIASGAMFLSIPFMYMYKDVVSSTAVSDGMNSFLMFLCGCTVNGCYALITTAVSADLGTHESLKGNSEALAMVTAIIDGTGSLGACITGIAVGWIKKNYTYTGVFVVLEISAAIAGCMLLRLVVKEFKVLCGNGSKQTGPGSRVN